MGMQGDFLQLLKEQGYTLGASTAMGTGHALTNATTILAFKYRDGVLVAGDRRATAGNMVMYDRTDKVLEIDHTSPYYRRSHDDHRPLARHRDT